MLSSRDVVPGDVVLVNGYITRLEVDAVLLHGTIITNEAMLTGESLPVTKVAVPLENDELFCEVEHKHHLLYSGTQVLQVRGAEELPALVIKTGFYTERGELVRSILFPKPTDFYFYKDLLKMVFIFLLLGLSAMTWSIHKKIVSGYTWSVTLLYSLDLVTLVVPPLLPATLTAINVWAQQRLKKQKVFCLSSNYISLAGSVDLVCFDKTGTLTEEDLDLAGVMQSCGGDLKQTQEDLTHLPPGEPLTKALATCHSLALIGGKLRGSPLDVKIFSGIAWTLQEPAAAMNPDYGTVTQFLVRPQAGGDVDPNQYELAVLKIFPFESSEQRMTVVVRARTSTHMEVFIKGAPERVAALCNPDTVPRSGLLEAAVGWYTNQGLRVLGVAGKTMDGQTWEQVKSQPREKLEQDATFLGLVLLQNKIKPETAPVLATLHQAQLTPVMITGDNLLTALSVARQSSFVPPGHQIIIVKAVMEGSSSKAAQHLKVFYYDADAATGMKHQIMPVRSDNYALATDGETFDLLFQAQDKTIFHRLLHKGRVFARMKPDQKITVVETLQHLGHQVAMCGDGCNDCGALKAADAGISLSSAEASVAAPFTSRQDNITCVPILLREGRAVLVSIFSSFKYNVVSAFGGLICVMLNYEVYTELSDSQYVVMDLLLMTVPPLVMGCTAAAPHLDARRPQHRILSLLTVVSMLSFVGFQTAVYLGMLNYLRMQPWFVPLKFSDATWPPHPSHENTTLILVYFYYLVFGVLVFSHAAPHLKPIYTNYALTGHLVLVTVFCIFVTFYTGQWCLDLMNFKPFPDGFVTTLFFISCIVFVACFIWERWVLYGLMDKHILPFFSKHFGRHPLHVKLEKELQGNLKWPVLTEAPDFEDGVMSAAEEKLMDEEVFGSEEENDDVEKAMFVRKLTRRHHFNATVTHIPKNTKSGDLTLEATTATSTSPTNDGTHGEHKPLIDQNSVEYRDPWDCVDFNGGSELNAFNQSVSHQATKGPSIGFKTFKGSRKTPPVVDGRGAYAYEVVPLSSNYEEPQEAIYSTISEIAPGDYKHPYEATDVPLLEEEQETAEPTTEVGRQEDTELRANLRAKGGYEENNQKMKVRTFEQKLKNPDAERTQGLMQQMDVAWHRISGSPLLPACFERKTFRESAAAEIWCRDLLYDIPKPPRPVEKPYSPQAEDASQSFPLHPPVTSSEGDPQQTSQDHNC